MRIRTALVLVFAACHPAPATNAPFQAPAVDESNEGAVAAPVVDAGIDIEPDATAQAVTPTTEYVVSYDKTEATQEEIEFVPPEDDGASPDVTIENGVTVARTSVRMWCATRGRAPGLCYDSQAECKGRNSRCARRSNYACALYTTRTDGKSHAICTDTYGTCLTAMVDASNDSEVSETGECIVMRYDPKAKK